MSPAQPTPRAGLSLPVLLVAGLCLLAVGGGGAFALVLVMFGPSETPEVASEVSPNPQLMVTVPERDAPIFARLDGGTPQSMTAGEVAWGAVEVGDHELTMMVGPGCPVEGECCDLASVSFSVTEGGADIEIDATDLPSGDFTRPVKLQLTDEPRGASERRATWNDVPVSLTEVGSSALVGMVMTPPGRGVLRLEVGSCEDMVPGCTADASCPEGCASETHAVDVACSEETLQVVKAFPAGRSKASDPASGRSSSAGSGRTTGGRRGGRSSATASPADEVTTGRQTAANTLSDVDEPKAIDWYVSVGQVVALKKQPDTVAIVSALTSRVSKLKGCTKAPATPSRGDALFHANVKSSGEIAVFKTVSDKTGVGSCLARVMSTASVAKGKSKPGLVEIRIRVRD